MLLHGTSPGRPVHGPKPIPKPASGVAELILAGVSPRGLHFLARWSDRIRRRVTSALSSQKRNQFFSTLLIQTTIMVASVQTRRRDPPRDRRFRWGQLFPTPADPTAATAP